MVAKLWRRSFWYWDRHSSIDGYEIELGNGTAPSRAGIVVVLGWMLSRRKNLGPYTRLYKSRFWDCLVCHPQVFNLFYPSRATTLALSVLEELVKELEKHPCPVVFAVFSGGHKACLYKIIQILQGKCSEVNFDEGRFDVVMRCLSGLMFDSSPVDFTSYLGAKFVSHQVLTFQPGRPIGIISQVAYAVGRGVDIIFSRQLGPQRIDLWQALYSSVKIGPILFLCSENDKLAPVETIQMFAMNLRKLGGQVDISVWKESEHVGHFRLYPEQYSAEVIKFLRNATSVYSDRLQTHAKNMFVTGSVVDTGDFGVSFKSSGLTWTDLPDSLTSEIIRVSRLPHIHIKKGNKGNTENNVFHGIEPQTCSSLLDHHAVRIRSRL